METKRETDNEVTKFLLKGGTAMGGSDANKAEVKTLTFVTKGATDINLDRGEEDFVLVALVGRNIGVDYFFF